MADPFADATENPFDDHSQAKNNRVELDPRTNELYQREQELNRREEELNSRKDAMRKYGRNNWPPFYPLVFHSIQEEIPEPSRLLITRVYQLWLVLVGTLLVNTLACIFILTSGSSSGLSDLLSSIGYLFFIPLSFLLWYRPIYNGYMKEQALYYWIYFIFGGFHLVFSAYMIVGIPSTGSAGLIQTIRIFSSSLPAGIIGIVATVGWTVQGVGLAWYYRQIWYHHKRQDHTFAKAQNELATHGAKAYLTREVSTSMA